MSDSDDFIMPRQYYSVRTGSNPNAANFDLAQLQRLFVDTHRVFVEKCYFQQAFGYHCVDAGDVPGDLGSHPALQIELALMKSDLWPIRDHALNYSEDDVFDLIEFLYDQVSQPVEGYYHQHCNCGWHYEKFDRAQGQMEFRAAVNRFLPAYADGYELSAQGEILTKGPEGLSQIFSAEVPHADDENIGARVRAAQRKYRLRGSSIDDRRDAVRDLADVLERLRPQVKQVLTKKDESDIFELANRFGIRHHDEDQKTNYDKAIWYSWAFYYYLATIHALLRLIERRRGEA